MKQPNIQDTLFDYVTDEKKWFYWYHSPERLKKLYTQDHENDSEYKEDEKYHFIKRRWRFKEKTVTNKNGKTVVIEKNLADFFDAVLDEVRLKKANDFAEYALYISDNEDLAYFRNTVAKREIVADIDYNRQRDHAVHTLYNYLLGWYIFEHSKNLKDAFQSYFEKNFWVNEETLNLSELLASYNFESKQTSLCGEDKDNLKASIRLVHEFADVWHITSLLHDIGYILEGNLSSASPNVEHDRVTNGSKIIHDYFNHYFWKSFEVDFRGAKNIAKMLGVAVPDFKSSESLASLGDRLCDIGDCENIRKELDGENHFQNKSSNEPIKQPYGLNREAFSIWKAHYKFYRINKMENILCTVETVYKNMMWVGSDYGGRNLDHGVCSGLITLQALTFFRELYWGFNRIDWDFEKKDSHSSKPHLDQEKKCFKQLQEAPLENSSDRVSENLFNRIKAEITRVPKRILVKGKYNFNISNQKYELHSDFWFNKILWATASSAIHAIVQKPAYTKQFEKQIDSSTDKPMNLKVSKIGYRDDPLAFLGVFVDVLQEWDRYKVTGRGEAAFTGDEPLQSTEVYLYPNKHELEKSCQNKACKNESCKVKAKPSDERYADSIYLTYPKGDNKKDWITELDKTMNRGLENNRNSIVQILACSNNG